jgi:hypothetical protein
MATENDLCGVGMPPAQANQIGLTPSKLTCASTSAAGAAVMLTNNVELSTAGGATACIPPTGDPVGQPYYIVNPSSTTAILCVPTNQYLNGSQNGTLNIAQNKQVILIQYKLNYWATNLTA